MNERIKALTEKTIQGKMRPVPQKVDYDKKDLFLSPVQLSGKRVCEYILAQIPVIAEESAFTGLLLFDGSVEGDIFTRSGHKNFAIAMKNFYNQPVDNLLTFEWQHATGDFEKIIRHGVRKIKQDIEDSEKKHKKDAKALEFLQTQTDFCNALIAWAHKCSAKAFEKSQEVSNEGYRKNLLRLSDALMQVPEKPAQGFYEAVLSLYICYPYLPDSIGLIDRYLYPYYKKDIAERKITQGEAKEFLQELFLMLQARISIESDRFYRGGESHFCVGGYLENGEDGFNVFSRLIVDALMDLPTWIPQISLRWTKKTPTEVLRYLLDCERKDANKRIAFVNDDPRIKGLMKYTGFSYKEAINYTMIGCNELSVSGGIVFGFDPLNVVRSVENTFYKRGSDILAAEDFEAFYRIYQQELFRDLWEAEKISKGFQALRERDCNIVSNIFFDGCIANAKSVTQGGIDKYIAVGLLIGISNVIDSLAIVKQFVYDEKKVTMQELTDALSKNWNGFEDLRTMILKKGSFFGNDDARSNGIARRFTQSLVAWNNTENYLHKKWIFGNLIGYNEHHKFFGSATKATPDGRYAGSPISFGLGQSEGKDKNGLTALLNSVAKCDPDAILTGPSVTNLLLEETLVKEDANFEKLVYLLETYFQSGGTHFQLNYVSKADLIAAQKTPEKYKNLRVRVSGFSDYFIFLNLALQDEIITRTKHTS